MFIYNKEINPSFTPPVPYAKSASQYRCCETATEKNQFNKTKKRIFPSNLLKERCESDMCTTNWGHL